MTIGDVITAALQDLGLLAAGEVPAPEDSALALARVNDWLDGLTTEGLALFGQARTTWPLVPGVSTYTVGVGQTVNVAAPSGPEAIENLGYLDTSQSPVLETLLGRPLTEDAYAAIPQKALQSGLPTAWYYRRGGSTGTLIAYPVPTDTSLEGVLYTAVPLGEFTALTDVLALPAGYRRFYRTNLAVELAPAFAVSLPPTLLELASAAKADIKRANLRVTDLSTALVSTLGTPRTLSRAAFDAGQF